MFALSSFSNNVIEGIVYTLLAGLVVAMVRAGMQTRAKMQTEKRDATSTNIYLFGKEANPRTGEPATKGWTQKTDERLTLQDSTMAEISAAVHSLSGELHRLGQRIIGNTDAAAAKIISGAKEASQEAVKEVALQVVERDRVQKRDDAYDERDNTP